MKKTLLAVLLAMLPACGADNSSTVRFSLDEAGCLLFASGYDWSSEAVSKEGVRTVNYRWDCASYLSPLTGRAQGDKQVTLTFAGTECLTLTAELVLEGYCLQGKAVGP